MASHVQVDDRFRQLGEQYTRATRRALGEAGAVAVAAARQGGKGQYAIQDITSKTKATPVHKVRRGWRLIVFNEDFRAVMFDRGTYSRRVGKLSGRYRRTAKAEAEAAKKGSGVKPQRFMLAASRAAKIALPAAIRREFR